MGLNLFTAAEATSLIASSLFELYKKRTDLDDEFKADKIEQVEAGVNALISGNFLDEDKIPDLLLDIFKHKDISKSTLIKNAIKKLQRNISKVTDVDLGKEFVDGFFGVQSWKHLIRSPRCNGNQQFNTELPTVTGAKIKKELSGNIRRIRFWYETQDLPTIENNKDPEDLLHKAWIEWLRIANIDVLKATSKQNANLLIFQEKIDSRGGVLADANLGPIGRQIATLRFDTSESPWTEHKFLFTAMHEIGHLLGLTHSTGSGELMSAFYNPNISSPTAKDTTRLLELKGTPWKPAPPKVFAKKVEALTGKPDVTSAV